MKKNLLILLQSAAFMLAVSLQAQDRTITGKVTGADDGLPLPGVNILIKGTTKGTATDAGGNYSISIPLGGGGGNL